MSTRHAARLLIGELAEAVGVNPKTIRYYEDLGLLPEPDRTESGYRTYTDEDVDRLRFVRQAQQLDLRLDEIGEILALRERGEMPCGYVLEVAGERLADLDARISEMQAARRNLATLLATAEDLAERPADYCPLIEHHRPA